MTADQFGGIARTVLGFGAGWLVSKGYVDQSTALQITGALGTLAIAGWSMWTNRPAKIVS
jgi:hypothetical protein